ncbi:class I SAM-dependent methyltransferase [Bacillus timonensis]|nr:class I SAM-dependent methyltransferase [Bacillus timonensis]
MNYGQFAYYYDKLMQDVDYEKWVSYINHHANKYSSQPIKRILDLACGTGELSILLSQAGFDVVGIDLSEDMLSVAQSKSTDHRTSIEFLQQNMTELSGLDLFDCIVIFCDSLNYLETEDQVKETFQRVFDQLKNGGLFMFDIHSIYKISQIFMNQTFAGNDEEISFIWNCYPGPYANSVEHDLSFFVKKNDDAFYYRFDEFHLQRTFSVQEYKKWIEEIGFTLLEITGDFDQPVTDQSERIFFTVKK